LEGEHVDEEKRGLSNTFAIVLRRPDPPSSKNTSDTSCDLHTPMGIKRGKVGNHYC
jgi:hypothetical protein